MRRADTQNRYLFLQLSTVNIYKLLQSQYNICTMKVQEKPYINIMDFYDMNNFNQAQVDALKKTKSRAWTFIVYPESAPTNWKELVSSLMLPWTCVLHDSDQNDGKDGLKKEHYHIMIIYNSPTTFKNINDLIRPLTNGPFGMNVANVKGMYEYFTHKNNPDKYQYDESIIECYNGFDIRDYAVSVSEKRAHEIIKELRLIIVRNQITELSELALHAQFFLEDEYTEVIDKHTVLFNTFITSFRSNPYKAKLLFEKALGEIIDVSNVIKERDEQIRARSKKNKMEDE